MQENSWPGIWARGIKTAPERDREEESGGYYVAKSEDVVAAVFCVCVCV